MQKEGGTFILKVFGVNLDVTLQLLALLCAAYTTVDIVKPNTSRPANDERYVVCRGFCRTRAPKFYVEGDTPLTRVCCVGKEWQQATCAVISSLALYQNEAIEQLLRLPRLKGPRSSNFVARGPR